MTIAVAVAEVVYSGLVLSYLKNAAMVPASPRTAYVLLHDKATPDRGATKDGIEVESAAPIERTVLRNSAPSAVPVNRAWAKGPPRCIEA